MKPCGPCKEPGFYSRSFQNTLEVLDTAVIRSSLHVGRIILAVVWRENEPYISERGSNTTIEIICLNQSDDLNEGSHCTVVNVVGLQIFGRYN